MKKILCIIMALCLLLASLVACAKDGTEDDEVSDTVETVADDNEDRRYVADLPELNFNGKVVKIASRDKIAFADEFYSQGLESTVGSAVFKRNNKVEDTLGVKPEVTLIKDANASTHSTVIETIEKVSKQG